jgi:hypothetical protein
VDVTEDGGKRYIKSTGIFSGLELHMFMEPPHYDPRLPPREDRPEMDFSKKRFLIKDDSQWQEVRRLADFPIISEGGVDGACYLPSFL